MKLIIFITFFIYPSCVFLQNTEEVIQKVNQSYATMKQFSCDIKYSYFINHDTSNATETTDGKYYVKNNSYRLELGDIIIISNDSQTLTINTKEKFIVISNSIQGESYLLSTRNIKKSAKEINQVYIDNNSISLRQMSSEKNNSYEYIDLKVDNKSWLIEEWTCFYANKTIYLDNKSVWAKPKIKIVYSNYIDAIELSEDLFNINNYVTCEQGLYSGTNVYKNYNVTQI